MTQVLRWLWNANPYSDSPWTRHWWAQWPYTIKCVLWHRYDRLVMPTLGPTWNEWDERLLHAVMAVFVDYYEVGGPGRWYVADIERELADPDCEEHTKEWLRRQMPVAQEEEAIYRWWMVERAKRPDPTQDVYVAGGRTGAAALASHELERRQYEEDNEMIRRVVAIREGMWT